MPFIHYRKLTEKVKIANIFRTTGKDVCSNVSENRGNKIMKISIIVPVYNVESYIRKCIQSILSQSYTDIELILVDDCSMDASGQICDEFAKKDDRVTVVHQLKNCGVSKARNTGMEKATGEYLMFVDSDDWIEPQLCERTVKILQEDAGIDTVHWGYNKVDEQGRKLGENAAVLPCGEKATGKEKEIFLDSFFVSYEDLYYWFKSGQSYAEAIHKKKKIGSVCLYLFSRECILHNQIKFLEDLNYGEDNIFLVSYIQACKGIAVAEGLLYNYVVSKKDSLSKNKMDMDKKVRWMEALETTVIATDPAEKVRCRSRWQGQRVLVVMNTARRLAKSESLLSGYKKFKTFAKHSLCREAYQNLSLKNAPFKYKCAMGMIKCHLYFLFYGCIWAMKVVGIDFAPMD